MTAPPVVDPPQLFAVPDPEPEIRGSAILSDDGLYRYSLARWWDGARPRDLWIMCNPSKANHEINDNTIIRCIGFSRRFGSGGFVVANAYGYRATKPADMWAALDAGVSIIGPENDGWLKAHLMVERGRVIVAWGAHPKPDRVAQVLELIRASGREPLCLGTTKDGQPRHPLMLRNDAQLRPWTLP